MLVLLFTHSDGMHPKYVLMAVKEAKIKFLSVAEVLTCCTVCEENSHYPGCWWVRDFLVQCDEKLLLYEHVKGAIIISLDKNHLLNNFYKILTV